MEWVKNFHWFTVELTHFLYDFFNISSQNMLSKVSKRTKKKKKNKKDEKASKMIFVDKCC